MIDEKDIKVTGDFGATVRVGGLAKGVKIMKYVYVKAKNTLDVARHEVASEKFTRLVECLESDDCNFEEISYQEYRAIVNGKIEAQLEILDEEETKRQRAYNATKKELYAKMLRIDEVTE